MYIRLYNLLCNCTQRSFKDAKVYEFGIDPADYTKPHGARVPVSSDAGHHQQEEQQVNEAMDGEPGETGELTRTFVNM